MHQGSADLWVVRSLAEEVLKDRILDRRSFGGW